MLNPPNQIMLTAGGTDYPCVFPPEDLFISAEDKETSITLDDGHRPIRVKVWMTLSQFKNLPADVQTGQQPVGIKMKGWATDYSDPGEFAERELKLAPKFYVLKASIVRHGVAKSEDDTGEALYRLSIVSEAWWWRNPSTNTSYRHFNILGPGKFFFYKDTAVDEVTPYSMDNMMGVMCSAIGIPPMTFPNPISFPLLNVSSFMPPDRMLDRFCRPYGCHIVADPFSNAGSINYSIAALDYTNPDTPQLQALAEVAGIEGANVHQDITAQTLVPASVMVVFSAPAKYKKDVTFAVDPVDDVPDFLQESDPADLQSLKTSAFNDGEGILHNNPVAGGRGRHVIYCGDRFIGDNDGGTRGPTDCDDDNDETGSDTIFMDPGNAGQERADAYFGRVNIPHNVWMFAGGYPIVPGATIRRVKIVMDNTGWTTTVWEHGLYVTNREDEEDLQNGLDTPTWGQFNTGPGGVFVAYRDDGTVDFDIDKVLTCVPEPSMSSSSSSSSHGSTSSGSESSQEFIGSESSESGPCQCIINIHGDRGSPIPFGEAREPFDLWIEATRVGDDTHAVYNIFHVGPDTSALVGARTSKIVLDDYEDVVADGGIQATISPDSGRVDRRGHFVTGITGDSIIVLIPQLLDHLGDVTITGPVNGQILKYDGAKWVNGTTTGGISLEGDDGVDPPPGSHGALQGSAGKWIEVYKTGINLYVHHVGPSTGVGSIAAHICANPEVGGDPETVKGGVTFSYDEAPNDQDARGHQLPQAPFTNEEPITFKIPQKLCDLGDIPCPPTDGKKYALVFKSGDGYSWEEVGCG